MALELRFDGWSLPAGNGESYVARFYKMCRMHLPGPGVNATVTGQGAKQFNLSAAQNISKGKALRRRIRIQSTAQTFLGSMDGFGVQAKRTQRVSTAPSINRYPGIPLRFRIVEEQRQRATFYYDKGRSKCAFPPGNRRKRLHECSPLNRPVGQFSPTYDRRG